MFSHLLTVCSKHCMYDGTCSKYHRVLPSFSISASFNSGTTLDLTTLFASGYNMNQINKQMNIFCHYFTCNIMYPDGMSTSNIAMPETGLSSVQVQEKQLFTTISDLFLLLMLGYSSMVRLKHSFGGISLLGS